MKKSFFLSVLFAGFLFNACSQSATICEESIELAEDLNSLLESSSSSESSDVKSGILDAILETGKYTTRDSVAAYICKYNKLPDNYVSKAEGIELYNATGNTFSKWNFNPLVTLGVMIGGDVFNNYASDEKYYHETLPEGSYKEADVDYNAKNRGTKRLVYQENCVIYYTSNHYDSFSRMIFD